MYRKHLLHRKAYVWVLFLLLCPVWTAGSQTAPGTMDRPAAGRETEAAGTTRPGDLAVVDATGSSETDSDLTAAGPADTGAVHEWLTQINGREAYIAWPSKALPEGERYPVLMAIHGSGREAGSYMPGHARSKKFYIHQRDLALKKGYLFAVISNGRDTWGTDTGMKNLLALYDRVREKFPTEEKWVLWASSAGGVLMYRMVKEHPEKVRKILGTFPVYDLSDAFRRLESARKAWKEASAFEGINPADDPEALTAVPALIFHGRKDTAVPAGFHSKRLRREVNARGGQVKLHMVRGGHSTENWHLYKDRRILRFLGS